MILPVYKCKITLFERKMHFKLLNEHKWIFHCISKSFNDTQKLLNLKKFPNKYYKKEMTHYKIPGFLRSKNERGL